MYIILVQYRQYISSSSSSIISINSTSLDRMYVRMYIY